MATEAAAPGMMTLDRADGSTTIDLYRAALGPVHTDFYLKAFTRFDAEGRSGPSWNWTAALLTLNWMLFRRLWSHILAYVGALTAALLLFFGIGRLVFQLSDSSQWALMAVAVLLAIAVPGAWGNAWLYATCNRRIDAALAAVASMEEASTLLGQQTSGHTRQGAIAAGNLALLGAIAGLVLNWPSSSALPLKTSKMEQARLAPAETLTSGLGTQNVVVAAASPLSAPAAQAAASAAAPAASAAGSSSLPLAAPVPSTATLQRAAPGATTRISQGLVQMAADSAALAKATAPVASAPPEAVVLAAPAAKPSQAALRAQAQQEKKEKRGRAQEAAQAKAAALAAASNPAPADGPYLINVGLFADANNARNAYAKLQDAGLPAITQELKSAKGLVRTRVRSGPFASQAEADHAADTIRALRLDAAVFKP
jgi:cell division septation protein DedD